MRLTRRGRHVAVVAIVLSVLLASFAGGLATYGLLTDTEAIVVSIAAADTFSQDGQVEVDYEISLSTFDQDVSLDGGNVTWTLTRVDSSEVALAIDSVLAGPLTFAVPKDRVLTYVNASDLSALSITLEDGSSLASTVQTSRGTEWLVFTLDDVSTREVTFNVSATTTSSVTGASSTSSTTEDGSDSTTPSEEPSSTDTSNSTDSTNSTDTTDSTDSTNSTDTTNSTDSTNSTDTDTSALGTTDGLFGAASGGSVGDAGGGGASAATLRPGELAEAGAAERDADVPPG